MKDKILHRIAFGIRCASVPPVMAALLILLVYINGSAFVSNWDWIGAVIYLVIIPVLAYPVSVLVPSLKKGGRKTQRDLAFIFSGVGYFAAIVHGIVFHKTKGLLFIYLTYFFSIIILSLVNRFSKTHASGHACSVIWPIVLGSYYYMPWGILIGALVYGIILWASLKTKRHTAPEFLLGTCVCLVSAAISALAIYLFHIFG